MNAPDFKEAGIQALSVHLVGNKVQDEPLFLSEQASQLHDGLGGALLKLLKKHFKEGEYYQFCHQNDLRYNEVYGHIGGIFEEPSSLHLQSQHIARHLYAVSDHPNIKSGELHVIYIRDCLLGDEIANAVAILKTEQKDTFIKVLRGQQNIELQKDEGISLQKLDKGCLIFNIDRESGYRLVVADQTNRGEEAQYWKQKFLQVQPRKDDWHHTQNYMQMCRDFAVEAFPEADRIDQLSIIDESARYFKENDMFEKHSFEEKVLQAPEVIEAFEQYKKGYQEQREVQTFDEFDINPAAVKKMQRVFKSIIKLDKNFHIYVHGNRNLIKKGFDEESKMHYYQVYFKEES
jgi:hypothetical protein